MTERGGAMLGVFRLVVGERVRLYELVTIQRGADGFEMRLKHFEPDLASWEEKEECLVWPHLPLEGTSARFGPVLYERDGDTLRSFVEVGEGESVEREELVMRRVADR